MKRIYYVLVMLLAVSFTACEDDDLPKPTQTGAGVMAAKINGKPWQHNSGGGTLTSGEIHVSFAPGGTLQLIGRRVDGEFNNSMPLELKGLTNAGEFTLKEKASGSYGAMYDYKNQNDTKRYETTATSTGRITITKLDTENKIISGTFSFRAFLQGSTTEYMEVTDGRFDVRYE